MRLIDADALTKECGDWYVEECPEEGFIGTLQQLLSEQPAMNCSEFPNNSDTISRQQAIDVLEERLQNSGYSNVALVSELNRSIGYLMRLPSAQPSHNITMNDVLKYIDGMPEDVWQEFTCCLECRGWELQRRTAKWCGSDFA